MSMTVGQLINELKLFDVGQEVRFAYPYGDHCNTTVAVSIDEVDEGTMSSCQFGMKLDDQEQDESVAVVVMQ